MAKSNVEVVREMYESFIRGDYAQALEALDPEIEWHETEFFPHGEIHRGHGAVWRNLEDWLETFDDYRLEVRELYEQEGKVIAVLHHSGKIKNADVRVDSDLTQVWTFKDGKAVRAQIQLS